MLRARSQAQTSGRRHISYWSAAKSITALRRETAATTRANPRPTTNTMPQYVNKSMFPPGLTDERIGELQLRQLEEDALHFIERPDLADLHRFVGKDAFAGAKVVQDALLAIADRRPKMGLDPGRSLPDEDQLLEYSESEQRYKMELRETLKKAIPLGRAEAARVRQEAGESEHPTLLPPVEVEVPRDFLATQVELLVERIEYRATVSLGILWQHVLSKVPAVLDRVANFNVRSTWDTLKPHPTANELKAEYVEMLKALDPSAELPKRLTLEHIKSAFNEYREASKNHAKFITAARAEEDAKEEKTRTEEAKKTAAVAEAKRAEAARRAPFSKKPAEADTAPPAPEQDEAAAFGRRNPLLMAAPRNIDPRDWAMFLLNRIVYYSAVAVAWYKAMAKSDPYLSESAKKTAAVVDPTLASLRDEFIDLLKQLEKKTPSPWDEQEMERVRSHGLQEKMTMKEAALILGMNNDRVLRGEFEETEIKEAHRAVMRQNHPDTLGSNYLALKINKAKEVLTKGSGIEGETTLYETEKEERDKMVDPEYIARQRPSQGLDPEAERLARFDQDAAAAIATKLRAKRKLRSWYWHKTPLWRRLLGLGPEFFPIEKEAMRMYERMADKRQRRPEVGRMQRRVNDEDWANKEHKELEYRAQRRNFRLTRRVRWWLRSKSRYFSYWFYWRLSRPIPLLWRLPLFAFVRVPLLITLYPVAVLGFALWYPFVLLGRVLRPVPGMLVKPFPPIYRWIRRTVRAGLSLPDQSPEGREERKERLNQSFERFASKGTLRRLWRRVSDALYQRAHPEESKPEWDPEFLKKTIREELKTMKDLRMAYKRDPKNFTDEDEPLGDEVTNESEDKFKSPSEVEAEKRQTQILREQAKRRGR